LPGLAAEGQAVSYGVRPTDLRLAPQGIEARVIIVEPTGAETELLVEVGGQQMVVVLHGRTQAQPGDQVFLTLDVAKSHVFDAASGLRLG
jgi:multiple sugar transport system ATP-binding protein